MKIIAAIVAIILWLVSIAILFGLGGGYFIRAAGGYAHAETALRREFKPRLHDTADLHYGSFAENETRDGEIYIHCRFDNSLVGDGRVLDIYLPPDLDLKYSSYGKSKAFLTESVAPLSLSSKTRAVLAIPYSCQRLDIRYYGRSTMNPGSTHSPMDLVRKHAKQDLLLDSDVETVFLVALDLNNHYMDGPVGIEWILWDKKNDVWTVRRAGTCGIKREPVLVELNPKIRSKNRATILRIGGLLLDILTAPFQVILLIFFFVWSVVTGTGIKH